MDRDFWRHRRVLVTGHTGFKGSWLSLWLLEKGARVWGFALGPATQPNLFEATELNRRMHSCLGDLADRESLRACLRECQPEVVFHLAAQSLVLPSHADPLGTFATNIMGTAHVLEEARHCPDLRALVVVTSDKCYAPPVPSGGYAEDHPLGGDDPYSASKACAEIVTHSYRHCFLRDLGLATARAGNVIGGGDWAAHRLIPDLMRALPSQQPLEIRFPQATRPWQHVLEPLSGYLQLAQALWEDPKRFSQGWNFGPPVGQVYSVGQVVATVESLWGTPCGRVPSAQTHPSEAHALELDSSRVRRELGWRDRLELPEALSWTVEWYRAFYQGVEARRLCQDDLDRYQERL